MEKRINASLLLAFYGEMLTERQRDMLTLYYEDDLSLSEIAALSGMSRQGAFDAIRRGERQLLSLEARLGQRARWERIGEGLKACRDALDAQDMDGARTIIDQLLDEEETDGI